MKKVGILTTFYSFDTGYSLCAVVRDQLLALTSIGYSPVLFVLPTFKDDELVPPGTEVRKIVPQLILEPYKGTEYPEHWKEDVAKAREMFEKNMEDIEVLFCHDIFFIDTFIPYNIALREAHPKLKCRIYAWCHSAPSTRLLLENNPHANRFSWNFDDRVKLVYLNHDKVTALAEYYGTWPSNVRVVYNARDPRTFWGLDPFVVKLINEYNLLDKDVITVYPLSTPRMISGKGLDKVIRIHAEMQKLGMKTALIVPNAHANGHKDKRLISETQVWASHIGLDHSSLVFTSLIDTPQHEMGVSSKIVSDLFRLANIFIFPTYSEVCSLVLLEAMMSGNLLVLNKEVQSLYEFGGADAAIYFDFTLRDTPKENESYFRDLALITLNAFENSKPLQAKRRAFKNHSLEVMGRKLEQLIHEE